MPETFSEKIEQWVYSSILQEKQRQRITFQVICTMKFLAKVKKNVRHFKVWIGPVLFIKILLKTAQLFSKYFPPGFSLYILYFLFHKGKDPSANPQLSVHPFVYVFPIFFHFHKCFNSFLLSKNLLKNKFFNWNMCFFIFLQPWRKGVVGFSLK